MSLSVGDKVEVLDEGLRTLRETMERITGKPAPPNHHGSVEEVWDTGEVLVQFEDGQSAPYEAHQVARR